MMIFRLAILFHGTGENIKEPSAPGILRLKFTRSGKNDELPCTPLATLNFGPSIALEL